MVFSSCRGRTRSRCESARPVGAVRAAGDMSPMPISLRNRWSQPNRTGGLLLAKSTRVRTSVDRLRISADNSADLRRACGSGGWNPDG